MSRGTSGSSDAFANVVQADAPPLPPVFPVMVRVSENVHPRGLDFSNQRKVVVLRDVYSKSFVDIAQEVRNVAGGRPSPRTCCQYYQRFSTVAGWKKSQYHQCGRRAWKLTADVRALPAAEVEEVKTRRLVHMQTLADRACPTEGYLRRGEHSAEVFEITRVQVASTRAEAEVHSCAHAGGGRLLPMQFCRWESAG